MKTLIKELWLAVTLILAASLLLLASDWRQRTGGKTAQQKYPAIAVMQITSTPLLDAHVAGVLDRLEAEGMVAPERQNLRLYNPQGDFPTANTIAREIVNSKAEMVITASTLALQTFSKANVTAKKPHVFGGVTDPYGAGVGITGKEPHQHPPYMAGIGTFQPVRRAFTLLHEMNPAIKRVGVVWNAGEQCSEACMLEARPTCRELGIELIEAAVGNTSEVSEAARSLIARGVEAIWIGGDTIATASSGLLISLARQAGIPVFTNDPADADSGALFGLGADYFTVGQYTADVAVAILRGKSPADFPIENVIPEQLKLNREVLTSLGGKFTVTPLLQKVLDAQSAAAKEPRTPSSRETEAKRRIDLQAEPAKLPVRAPWQLRMVLYSETEFAERCHDGLIDGIKQAGFLKGRDYELKVFNAQGDMSTLSSIMTTIKSDHPDLLMVISTPALQAALRQAGPETKIVFTGVGDGVHAGAGKSETEHLVNVTGITTRSPFDGMARIIRETLPGVKAVGTLFTPAEVNSVLYKDWFKEALAKQGIELVTLPVTSSADVAQSAAELCTKDIQALAQIVDNLTRPGFALIARKAAENNLPVYVFESTQMKENAVICLARDYYDAGLEAAQKAVRVLRGERPGDIPFNNTQSERLLLNYELAQRYKLNLPEDLTAKATPYSIKKP
jgi:ABC-type uncharacterized transport system substrate-binding protein